MPAFQRSHLYGAALVVFLSAVLLMGCSTSPTNRPIEIDAGSGHPIALPDSLYFSVIREITSDATGNVYVIEAKNHALTKFTPAGRFTTQVARKGQGPGEFAREPESVCVCDDIVYVSLRSSRRLMAFDQNLSFQEHIHLPDSVAYPYHISCGPAGFITAGSMEPRYQTNFMRYSVDGRKAVRLSLEKTRGQMYWDLVMVASHPDGTTAASYRRLPFLEIFNPDGSTRRAFRMEGVHDVPDLPEVKERTVQEQVRMFQRHKPKGLVSWGVDMDQDKNIYVLGADYATMPHREIYVYDVDGTLKATLVLPKPAKVFHVRGNTLYLAENNRTTLMAYKLPDAL